MQKTTQPITAHLVGIHAAALRLVVPDQAVGEGPAWAGGAGVWSGPAVWWRALVNTHDLSFENVQKQAAAVCYYCYY